MQQGRQTRLNNKVSKHLSRHLLIPPKRRKGENYLSVLPDAVPFLAEAAENEHPSLEAACRSLVKYMEQAFGQSLDSYFE